MVILPFPRLPQTNFNKRNRGFSNLNDSAAGSAGRDSGYTGGGGSHASVLGRSTGF